MGGCMSRPPQPASQEIDQEIKQQKKDERFHLKILVLGTTASGKSTLAKQIKILHSNGFTEDERQSYKSVLVSNLLIGFQELLNQAEAQQNKISRKNKKIAKIISEMNPYSTPPFDSELLEKTKELYHDKGIVKTLENATKFKLTTNLAYCFNNIERILSLQFEPTDVDILFARQRTTGIVETRFKVGKYNWSLIDVGGQASERRKWIHCFEGIHAMIYVTALDEYDVVSNDDPTLTKMEESLKIFEKVANNTTFGNVPILLFLNKVDLFKEKIKTHDLKEQFPKYEGGREDFALAVEFVKSEFISLVSVKRDPLIVYETCAIDTKQISVILEAVLDTIFKNGLRVSGLL